MQLITPLAIAALLASSASAHPGHEASHEIETRAAFIKTRKRDLSHCSAKLKACGLDHSSVQRRVAVAKAARKKRNLSIGAPYLKVRDEATVLATSHLSTEGYTNAAEESILFSGNRSCVLSPEVTQSPYSEAGEYDREIMIEEQEGVELIFYNQVLDMLTCDPIPDAMIEIWHCNSTGVYSGIVTSGNGDSSDSANINATFLRALQPTGSLGMAQFTTLFPGHYVSRATHIHVLVHFNGTSFDNGTYSGGYVSHVGQVFFNQDLITAVELNAPYNTNTQAMTANEDDSILAEEGASSDPVAEYSLLSEDAADGIFAWLAFGIDLTSEQTVSAAGTLYESGGVTSSSSVGGNSTGNSTGGPGIPSS